MSFFSSIRNGSLAALFTLAMMPLCAQQTGPLFVCQMSVLTGAAVVVGANTPLKYTPGGEASPPTIKNVVTLRLNETSPAYFSDNFTIRALVTIVYGADSTATQILTRC